MTGVELPMWVAVPASILLVASGLLTAIGSLGLLRLPSFQARMHGPSMGTTLGCGCILFASMLVSSATAGRPVLRELLITVFVVITAPATAMLLMRASLYRARSKAASADDEVVER